MVNVICFYTTNKWSSLLTVLLTLLCMSVTTKNIPEVAKHEYQQSRDFCTVEQYLRPISFCCQYALQLLINTFCYYYYFQKAVNIFYLDVRYFNCTCTHTDLSLYSLIDI